MALEDAMTRLKTVGLWLLQILTAFLMVAAGSQKFTSAPVWERMFRTWGFPDRFYLAIGAVEVVAGIGLLIPKIASVSALTLVVVMASAAITQITRGGRNGVGEMVFCVLVGIVAYARWRDAAWLSRRSSAAAPHAGA
jgi:putative oxidoreductase